MPKEYQGTFRKLIVWQKAKDLAKNIYNIANKFPKEETYGLVSQMKRCSVSVMSNIAEGNQRKGKQDRLNFFNIGFSSLTELDNQAELAFELKYIVKSEYDKLIELINKTGYLLFRFIEAIKNLKNLKDPNSPNNPNKKGFTLVELIVVVAIVAVMSVSTVVGFGYFGDVMRSREVAGIISDTLKQEELKVLRGDFESVTIYLLADYMIIEEVLEDSSFSLNFNGTACASGYQIEFEEDGNLIQKDEDGAILKIESVTPTKCIESFKDSEDIEWSYQLTSGNEFSDIVRFVHFNIQRDNSDNPISITSGVGSKILISAPYAKKTFYSNNSPVGWLELVVDENLNSENTITLR